MPLDDAVSVADDFLNSGEIVAIRGRNTDDTRHIHATSGDLANGKSLIVLINAGSAAAAEVVAGALQDAHRATLVGIRRLVQRHRGSVGTADLPLWIRIYGAIHLTTGHYVTPAGHLIEASVFCPTSRRRRTFPTISSRNLGRIWQGYASPGSYIPPDPKADKALNLAYDMLRNPKASTAVPPTKN